MRKTSKREMINLLFSAFLIIGYVVSMYFLNTLLSASTDLFTKSIIDVLSMVVFGLLLFYATRVGDGKQIKRLNIPALILVDIPALYVVLASLFIDLPLSAEITSNEMIVVLASIVLGYAIPYTFLSGYEVKTEEEVMEEKLKELEELEESVSDEDYQYTTLDIEMNNEEEMEEELIEEKSLEEADDTEENTDENADDKVESIDESDVLEKIEESEEENTDKNN